MRHYKRSGSPFPGSGSRSATPTRLPSGPTLIRLWLFGFRRHSDSRLLAGSLLGTNGEAGASIRFPGLMIRGCRSCGVRSVSGSRASRRDSRQSRSVLVAKQVQPNSSIRGRTNSSTTSLWVKRSEIWTSSCGRRHCFPPSAWCGWTPWTPAGATLLRCRRPKTAWHRSRHLVGVSPGRICTRRHNAWPSEASSNGGEDLEPSSLGRSPFGLQSGSGRTGTPGSGMRCFRAASGSASPG